MRHAEALLLIDDEKAKVVEVDLLLQKLVRADDEIDLAGLQVKHGLLDLRGRAEAREHVDRDRERREAAHGCQVMLLRQNGRRDQDCHLLAVQDALHGRAQRDLRLAEADVAAEQPVHGRGRLHIALDLVDAAQLVVGLRVFKALLKLLLPRRIRCEGKARQPLALGIELDKARSQILGRGLGSGLRLLPLVAAELIEPHGRILARADILADKIELRGRDVQAVRALIGDLDVILRHAADLQLLHADVAADAVVLVDDEVPGREVGERIELFAVRGLFRRARFLPLLPDGDLPLC